jgi:hypothetical protein
MAATCSAATGRDGINVLGGGNRINVDCTIVVNGQVILSQEEHLAGGDHPHGGGLECSSWRCGASQNFKPNLSSSNLLTNQYGWPDSRPAGPLSFGTYKDKSDKGYIDHGINDQSNGKGARAGVLELSEFNFVAPGLTKFDLGLGGQCFKDYTVKQLTHIIMTFYLNVCYVMGMDVCTAEEHWKVHDISIMDQGRHHQVVCDRRPRARRGMNDIGKGGVLGFGLFAMPVHCTGYDVNYYTVAIKGRLNCKSDVGGSSVVKHPIGRHDRHDRHDCSIRGVTANNRNG